MPAWLPMEVHEDAVSAGRWNDHSFTLGEEVTRQWIARLGNSSRIWPLWGTRPCLSGQLFRVSRCTIERMGSHCVSAAILVRHLWENAKVDMALTRRSNLISVFVLDRRRLRAIRQKHFLAWSVRYDQVILLQTEEHSLGVVQGLLWDFSG